MRRHRRCTEMEGVVVPAVLASPGGAEGGRGRGRGEGGGGRGREGEGGGGRGREGEGGGGRGRLVLLRPNVQEEEEGKRLLQE